MKMIQKTSKMMKLYKNLPTCYMLHGTFHYFFMFSKSFQPPKEVETNPTCTKGTTHIAAVRLPSLLDPPSSIERLVGSLTVYRGRTYLGAAPPKRRSEAKAGEISLGNFPVFQKK